MASSEEHKARSRIAKVDLDDLQVDPSYQRTPSPSLVDDVERDWDVIGSELLLVSDRGERKDGTGGLWLVDGQHRSIAARRLGIKKLDARIIDMSKEEDPGAIEARWRLMLNVALKDRATERFKAKLRTGDEESLDIVKILSMAETEVAFNPADPQGGITAIATIQMIYRIDGHGSLLRNTLELIKEAYGGFAEKAGTASMLKGMAWFIVANYEQCDHTRLIEKLREVQAAAIDRKARTIQGTMSGSLWFNYYRAIVDVYNERLTDRRRLEWISRGAQSLGGKTRKDQ